VHVVTVDNVSKRFGRITALQGFSATLSPGEIVGLLGPNGAGKSTLMRLLVGLVRPTEGRIAVLGEEMPRHRRRVMGRVGALVESPAFYEHLSGLANLRLLAGYYLGLSKTRADEVLDQVGLLARGGDPVSDYSIGMKRRLGLAAALLPSPELLVLDEPASGLDPEAVVLVQELLREEVRRGACVLLSSHLLSEVARVCDRVLVLRQGKLVGAGPAGERASEWTNLRVSDSLTAHGILTGIFGDTGVRADGDRLRIRADGLGPAVALRALIQAGVEVHEASPHRPSLEDYYFSLVNRAEGGE